MTRPIVWMIAAGLCGAGIGEALAYLDFVEAARFRATVSQRYAYVHDLIILPTPNAAYVDRVPGVGPVLRSWQGLDPVGTLRWTCEYGVDSVCDGSQTWMVPCTVRAVSGNCVPYRWTEKEWFALVKEEK